MSRRHGRWRVGPKLGRTVYLQLGDEPGDVDVFLGLMETPELAQQVVEEHNAVLGFRDGGL